MIFRLINRSIRQYFRGRGFLTAEHETRSLIILALSSAFRVFKDGHFRRFVDFYKQSETEQYRLFNELSVTALVLLKMCLDDELPRIPYDRKDFWQNVNSKIIDNFSNWLGNLGITGELADLWGKLFAIRLEEFTDNEAEARSVWHEEMMKSQDHARDEAAVRVGTVSINAFLHLRKDEPLEKDPLHRLIQRWIIDLNNQIAKRIGY